MPRRSHPGSGFDGELPSSMTNSLVREVVEDAKRQTDHDFGKNIIAGMYPRSPVYVYDFANNIVPGQTEKERGYWRDVRYRRLPQRQHGSGGCRPDRLSLYNDRWPIFTLRLLHLPPAKGDLRRHASDRTGHADRFTHLRGKHHPLRRCPLNRCIVSPKVRVNSYTHIEESILFEGVNVGRHCRIRRAIVDKNVELPAEMTIGYDAEEDRRRFHVTEGGVVVIPKGMKFT